MTNSGKPYPLGASLTAEGCNFAIYCPDAGSVQLCLFHSDTEETLDEFLLDSKTGAVWHIHIDDVKVGQLYAYRTVNIDGEEQQRKKLLIDPYARQLNRSCQWNSRQYQNDSQFMLPKCVVTEPTISLPRANFDIQRPRIIYEAHVKGLSQLHPKVPEEQRGTYIGAAHPSILEHLCQLGVTTVQFLPLASFMPEPFITEKGLTNYWGYNPVNFFAVEPRYACANAFIECKQMVKAYHQVGIEVIVDVVFNHTAEGGDAGTTLSLKGLCKHQAYLYQQSDDDRTQYTNNSGCGNSINVSHPFMLKLIMDAMRYWVDCIGIDGFRFDLAASLGRDPVTFSEHAGFFKAIQQDPILSTVLLIAEPWDIGVGGYQVGNFPDGWRECNDKFRDTVRAFWRGDQGATSDFATRVMGSRDIFHKCVKPVTTSVNPITYHDGFTLHDLVCYEDKHNEANLEDNRDGHAHNLSANYGVEGPTANRKINLLRERQKRNLFTTLLISQGTPHVLGGDELSRTQGGNNNAYCQDNQLSWINWDLNKQQQDFLEFCKTAIALRRESMLFTEIRLKDDRYFASPNVKAVNWYKPDGSKKAPKDWQITENQTFAMELKGDQLSNNEHWLVCFNASEKDVIFSLPQLNTNAGWTLCLDTRYSALKEQPKVCVKQMFLQAHQSIAIFTYSY